jgi:hypothetical protein
MSLQNVEDFMSNALSTIETRVKNIAAEIEKSAQAVSQAASNHNYLNGMLTEAKTIFDLLKSFNIPGPAGTVVGALDAAVNIADTASGSFSTDSSVGGLAKDASAILTTVAGAGIGGTAVQDAAKVANVLTGPTT